ncbi:MAG: putative dehydrogenase [Nitrospira sp.]
MDAYDVCIVGAGVVGCAVARELAARAANHPLRILVVEQRRRAGEETSSRNSGVLHSGIHEHPATLKGRLARDGSRLAVSYAVERGIPLLRSGMVIAVTWEDIRRGLWRDIAMLRRLWVNARRSRLPVSFVTPRGLRAWEPHLQACGAIIIPSICVIDPTAWVSALKADAEAAGVTFAFEHRVVGIDPEGDGYLVTTDRKRIRTAGLINAAGLHADEVASFVSGKTSYTIRPLRGEYYEIVAAEKKGLIGRLVYPALPPGAAGKGIHFSPRPNGRLFIGPNEVAVQDKADYASNPTPPSLFITAVQKFLPTLEERDLRWAYSGIRPSVMTEAGRKPDFIVAVDRDMPPFVNLIGIESPGLSAAMALAQHVVNLPCIRTRWRLSGTAGQD